VESIAGRLRREELERLLALSPSERIEIALGLGDSDAALFAAARAIPVEEARRLLRLQRQDGRRLSRCAREIES
jgi:mevalonate pyrophosphate decarboxylase